MKRQSERLAGLPEVMAIRFFSTYFKLFLFLWLFYCCNATSAADLNDPALSDPFPLDQLYQRATRTGERLQAVYDRVQERLSEVKQEKDRLVALYERLRIDASELEADLDFRPDPSISVRFLPLKPPSELEPAVIIPPDLIHTTGFSRLVQSYRNATDASKSARWRSSFTQTAGIQAWEMLLRAPEVIYRYEIALAKARAAIIAYRNYLEKWQLAKAYMFDAMEITRRFPDDEEMVKERRVLIHGLRGRYAGEERRIDLRDYAEWQDTVLTMESKRDPIIDEIDATVETLAEHYPWISTQGELDDTEASGAPLTPERPRSARLPGLPASPLMSANLAPLGFRQLNDALYAARKFRALLQKPVWETMALYNVDVRLSELHFRELPGTGDPAFFRPEGLVPRFRGEPVKHHGVVSTFLRLETFRDTRISISDPTDVVCGVVNHMPEPMPEEEDETRTTGAGGLPDPTQLRERAETALRLVTGRIEIHEEDLERSLQLEQRLRDTYESYAEQARLMQNELQQIPDLAIYAPFPPTFERKRVGSEILGSIPFDLYNLSMLEQRRQLVVDMFQALTKTFDHLQNPGYSADALERASRWSARQALGFLHAAPVLLIDNHLLMTQRLLEDFYYGDYLEKWNLHREFIQKARALHLQQTAGRGETDLNEREQLRNEYRGKERLLHNKNHQAWEELVTARTTTLNELFREVEQLLRGIPEKLWDGRPWLYELPVANQNWPGSRDFKIIKDRFGDLKSHWINITSLHLYLFFRHPADFGDLALKSQTLAFTLPAFEESEREPGGGLPSPFPSPAPGEAPREPFVIIPRDASKPEGPRIVVLPRTREPFGKVSGYQEAPINAPFAGIGVHLADGSFVHRTSDITLRSWDDVDFDFVRSYRSNITYEGVMGPNWDFNYNQRLVPVGGERIPIKDAPLTYGEEFPRSDRTGRGSDLQFFDGDGRLFLYTFKKAEFRNTAIWGVWKGDALVSTYDAPAGRFDELLRIVILPDRNQRFSTDLDSSIVPSSIFYVRREKDGTRYFYNCHGLLTRIIDRTMFRELQFGYAGPFNPLTLTQTLSAVKLVHTGTVIKFEYELRSERGPPRLLRLVARSYHGLEKTVEYSYNDEGRLHEVTLPGSTEQNPIVLRYTYGDKNLLTTITSPREVARDGIHFLKNEYSNGRVSSQTWGVPPEDGGTYIFKYDGLSVEVTDPGKNRTVYTLKTESGNIVTERMTEMGAEEGKSWSTSFDYYPFLLWRRVNFPKGNAVEYGRDAKNDFITLDSEPYNKLNQGNIRSIARISKSGNKLEQFTYTYEPYFNEVETVTDGRHYTTTYKYEPGFKRFEAYQNGRAVKIIYPDLTTANGTVHKDIHEIIEWTPFGPLKITDVGKHVTNFIYASTPDGFFPITRQHPDSTTRNVTYDDWWNERTIKDERDIVTKFEYDGRDRPTDRYDDVNGFNIHTSYKYDENDNVTRVEHEWKDTFDSSLHPALSRLPAQPRKHVRTYDYYVRGMLKSETVELDDAALTTTYYYDGYGNRRRIESPLSGVTQRFFNERNQLSRISKGSQSEVLITETFEYDGNGNLEKHIDNRDNATTYLYDDFDRFRGITDAAGNKIEHLLDDSNNIKRTRFFGHPGGPTPVADNNPQILLRDIEFEIDEHNHVHTRHDHVLEIKDGESVSNGILDTRYIYDKEGLLDFVIDSHGHKTDNDYDSRHRLTKVTDAAGNYTLRILDGNGNIEELHEHEAAQEGAAEPSGTYVTKSEYNSLNYQIAETDPLNRTTRFFWDSLGNLRAQVRKSGVPDGFATLYSWDALHRKKEKRTEWVRHKKEGGLWATKWDDLVTTYKYDLTGGALSLTIMEKLQGLEGDRNDEDFSSTTELHYDATGRHIKTVRPDGATFEVMEYNADGNPVLMKDANETKVTNTYDVLNRLVKRTIEPGDGIGGVTEEHYEYDGLGRMTAAGGEGYVGFSYDSLGRILSEQQASRAKVDDEDNGRLKPAVAFRAGRPLTPREPKVVTTTYKDTDHLTVTYTYPTLQFQVEEQYDPLERVSSTVLRSKNEEKGRVAYRYIGKNRVSIRTYSNDTKTHYFYDDDRLLQGIAHFGPQGRKLPRQLEPPLSSEEMKAVWDDVRVLLRSEDPLFATSEPLLAAYFALRDKEGNIYLHDHIHPLPQTQPNTDHWRQERRIFAYDSFNQIQSQKHFISLYRRERAGGSPLSETSAQYHQYRETGARMITDIVENYDPPTGLEGNVKRRELTIGRTAIGNVARYNPIKVDRLDKLTDLIPPTENLISESFGYEFDKTGNMIRDKMNNIEYHYDYRGRLVLARSVDDGTSVRYQYDPFDRLILRDVELGPESDPQTIVTWFIYNGEACIEEFPFGPEVTPLNRGCTSYVWGGSPGELVWMSRVQDVSADTESAVRNYFVHEDFNGSAQFFSTLRLVEKAGMLEIHDWRWKRRAPSIGKETFLPLPALGTRYEAYFEGNLLGGRPLFDFEKPINFSSRHMEEFRAELTRRRWEMDSWVLSRILTPFGGPVAAGIEGLGWVARLGLIATGNTSPQWDRRLENALFIADVLASFGSLALAGPDKWTRMAGEVGGSPEMWLRARRLARWAQIKPHLPLIGARISAGRTAITPGGALQIDANAARLRVIQAASEGSNLADDPFLDNNILVWIYEKQAGALKFAQKYHGLMSIDLTVASEFVAGGRSLRALGELMREHDIRLLEAATDAEATIVMKGIGRTSLSNDIRIIATARKHGVHLASGDRNLIAGAVRASLESVAFGSNIEVRAFRFVDPAIPFYKRVISTLRAQGISTPRDYIGPLTDFPRAP